MHTNAIIGAVVIFAIIIVGMFMYAFLKKEEIQQNVTEVPTEDTNITDEVPYASVTRIDARHYYIDGVHTFVGDVEFPTPCDLLEAESVVSESNPEKINLIFSVLNNSDVCVQKITQQRFKVSAPASKEATITATFMGRPIELNLIPAQEGETPEEFELFIKG